MEISPRVDAFIKAKFSEGDASDIREALASLGDDNPERIAAAVVILVERDYDLDGAIALVNGDWRDLLVAAHLSRRDWPDRLDALMGKA